MLKRAKRIVVKVGSQLLSGAEGLNLEFIDELSRQVAKLREAGREVILVSSGAVLAGIKALGLNRKPFSLAEKQALSAVGQPYLMAEYRRAFNRFGLEVAQVLLTAEDLRSKERFLNAKNTFEALLKFGVVPVVNENDTVSVEEIKIGDNDNLSAHVAVLTDADLLVMLTVSNGIYDKDPRSNPDAKLVPVVERPEELFSSCDFSCKTSFGTGGMGTKVEAASKAAKKGIPVIVAGGKEPDVLLRIVSGERVGTLFLPSKKLRAKTYRILYLMKPKGRLYVDEGAKRAVVEQGMSLLSKGVKRFEGQFEKGDAVEVCTLDGSVIGKGIVKCSSESLYDSKVCIHRDDFVLTGD
ncbi:glutamate 5-kinase [Thermovibrio ammonificans]|uniref:Glutamate 5-kinase n=1 Tax=Thermovibrio ammonificans (strain DSM 15698 / JCM 12110 / HB-1) TaxID=648996 RepID=E8T3E3_THEA1|nr:glutamate 5-kinase [Thermovibrio ammonificans]ADU97275.1 glutamate 5-kinase [Thermovibrio ammonificans HB-1]